MKALAIVVACGREEEVTPDTEAGFLTLGNTPMLVHSLKTLEKTASIDAVIIAITRKRVETVVHLIKRYGFTKIQGVVIGGATRQSTLKAVLSKLQEPPAVVVIHEASRPFVSREVVEETLKSAKRYGCAIAAHKLPDSVKLSPKGFKASDTLHRNTVWVAETPQAFKSEVLDKLLKSKGVKIVDDESEYVKKPGEVHMVEAGPLNMKIRTAEDLAIATALINAKVV